MHASKTNGNSGYPPPEAIALLPIHAVERETGVSKELLRMWERRYSFPQPQRDAQGDRIYPPEQVSKLRLLRRLVDLGFRPGKIISLDLDALETLLHAQGHDASESFPELERELVTALKSRDHGQIRDYLSHQLVSLGLQNFIFEFLQHANVVVGDAWVRGTLEVHEEHLFTEQIKGLMRHAIGNLSAETQPPRVILTTPPDEQHSLGMLMVEALLRLDNVDVVSYGAQMSVRDIAQAALRHRTDVVAVSFSASFPTSKAIEYLEELRFRLPASMEIWGGGSALRSTRRSVEGVNIVHELQAVRQAAQVWRRSRGRR